MKPMARRMRSAGGATCVNSTPPTRAGEERSQREVFGLRVVQHDGAGRLLRPELVLLAHHDAAALGAQEREQAVLVREVGAGGIAEGIARAAIALLQELRHLAGVLVGEAELGADP